MSWLHKTTKMYPPLTWASRGGCRFSWRRGKQGVTRHLTEVISTLSLTLPISNPIYFYIQPNLATLKIAKEDKFKRERYPILFLLIYIYN